MVRLFQKIPWGCNKMPKWTKLYLCKKRLLCFLKAGRSCIVMAMLILPNCQLWTQPYWKYFSLPVPWEEYLGLYWTSTRLAVELLTHLSGKSQLAHVHCLEWLVIRFCWSSCFCDVRKWSFPARLLKATLSVNPLNSLEARIKLYLISGAIHGIYSWF